VASRVHEVLFLCTGNSARSILAESLLRRLAAGRFRAHSAGSRPMGEVHPLALRVLETAGHDVSGLRSKSWDEVARPGAPALDFVFTLCDDAAGEACPVWPGEPITAHWGIPDPAAQAGSEEERRRAFELAYTRLEHRIRLFAALPFHALDRLAVKATLDAIGRARD
jgi:arsenate reductase